MCRLACFLMATRYDDHRNSHYNRHQCYNSQNRIINNEHSGQGRDKHYCYNLSPSSSKKRFRNSSSDVRQKDLCREEQTDNRKKDDSKQKIQSVGVWSEHRSSSGKTYYYNSQTEVSQWEKPPEWLQAERKGNSFGEKNQSKSSHCPAEGSSDGAKGISDTHSSASIGGPSSSNPVYYNYQENSSPRSSGLSQGSASPPLRRSNRHFHRSRSDISGSLSAGEHRLLKRERNNSPTTDNPCKSRAVGSVASSYTSRDIEDRKEGLVSTKEKMAPTQLDLSKLPQLLVELAQKYGIDLHEERAVDKLKLYLKKAVKPSAPVPSVENEGHAKLKELPPLKVEVMDTSPSCSASSPEHRKQPNEQQETEKKIEQKGNEEKDKDPLPYLSTCSHEKFCREDLTRHVRGWSAEYFEAQSWIWAGSHLNGSVQLGQIMADMKCARSLVRTAEIRSTLIDQRVIFVRQQIKQYDPQSKPSGGGGSGSTVSAGSS